MKYCRLTWWPHSVHSGLFQGGTSLLNNLLDDHVTLYCSNLYFGGNILHLSFPNPIQDIHYLRKKEKDNET